MNDDEEDPLVVPKVALKTAEAFAPIKVLSLTGGGYRGLFTAQVLHSLRAKTPNNTELRASVDVFSGTSIGGLMACALAIGKEPYHVLDAIAARGPLIFPKKILRSIRKIVFGVLYDSGHLRDAVDEVLGEHADTRMCDLEQGLLVPAIHWENGRLEIFLSGYFGAARASTATLREVCLATSAAPTYFKPAELDGAPMLDGGLAANNPDVLALLEIARRHPGAWGRMQLLSIGTASLDKYRDPKKALKAGAFWAALMPEFMIDLQERMTAMQCHRILGERYLRVDHSGSKSETFKRLDLASTTARDELLKAGSESADAAFNTHGAYIERFMRPMKA